MRNIFNIFIDSSNFKQNNKVECNFDEYITKYKKSKFYNSKWYISVKSFFIYNNFVNVQQGVNNKLIVYHLNGSDPLYTPSTIDTLDLTKVNVLNTLNLPDGSPNLNLLMKEFNNNFEIAFNLKITFNEYDYKLQIENSRVSKVFIYFGISHKLFGFENDKIYTIENGNTLTADYPPNLMNDQQIIFNLNIESDIHLKNNSYDNINKDKFILNQIFHNQYINTLPTSVISYSRQCDDKKEIIFDKQTLRKLVIDVVTNDYDMEAKIPAWRMELEIIQEFDSQILKIILIYLKSILIFWMSKFG